MLGISKENEPFPLHIFINENAKENGNESVVPMCREHDEEAQYCSKKRQGPVEEQTSGLDIILHWEQMKRDCTDIHFFLKQIW